MLMVRMFGLELCISVLMMMLFLYSRLVLLVSVCFGVVLMFIISSLIGLCCLFMVSEVRWLLLNLNLFMVMFRCRLMLLVWCVCNMCLVSFGEIDWVSRCGVDFSIVIVLLVVCVLVVIFRLMKFLLRMVICCVLCRCLCRCCVLDVECSVMMFDSDVCRCGRWWVWLLVVSISCLYVRVLFDCSCIWCWWWLIVMVWLFRCSVMFCCIY